MGKVRVEERRRKRMERLERKNKRVVAERGSPTPAE